MKHRERVETALCQEKPDRCPMQISFTPEFATRLKQDMNLTAKDFHNPHGGGNTYVMERALDEDMLLQAIALITGIPGPARVAPSVHSLFSKGIGSGDNQPIESMQKMYIQLR